MPVHSSRPTSEIKHLLKYPGLTIVDKIWDGPAKHSVHLVLDDTEVHELDRGSGSYESIRQTTVTMNRLRMDNVFIETLESYGVPTGKYSVVNPCIYQGLKRAGQDISFLTESVNYRVNSRPLSYNHVYAMESMIGIYFWIN